MKRKLIALLLALGLLLPCFALGVQAAGPYTIENPYESVNWSTWGAYKAQLHVHTNASDGEVPLDEVVEEHYRLGYDILAITDHMTLGMPWNQTPRTVPIMRLVKASRTGMAPMAPLTDARRQQILTGAGRDSGRPMLEVTQGIELNGAVPSNSHLQGFFCDFGQGFIGMDLDWETPVKRNAKAGGVTVLNHLGEPAGAEKSGDPLYYDNNPKWVDKFAYLFANYPTLLGMDVNSGTNDGTKFDAILYDRILEKVVPYDRKAPWAFTYSDAHSPGQFDRTFTIHMMPALTVDALRTSMEDGAFFGFARHARLDKGDGFVGVGDPPAVTNIVTSDAAGTISITASNFESIVWVADGEKILTEAVPTRGSYTKTLNLATYDAQIGGYVRAYLLGPGGILYIQPFKVLRDGKLPPKPDIPRVFDYSVPLGWVSAVADILFRFTPLYLLKWVMVIFDPYVDLPWIPWASLIGG